MNDNIKAGDKIWYETVTGGWIKAKVISTREAEFGMRYATIRVTSRGNRIFYCGYTFETSRTFMIKR